MKIIEATWRGRDGVEYPTLYSIDPSEVDETDLMATMRALLLMDSNVDDGDKSELTSAVDVTEEVHGYASEAISLLHEWAAGNKRKEYIGDVIVEEILQD